MQNTSPRYTAVLTHNHEVLMHHHHDTWEFLLAHLFVQMEAEQSGISGQIIDNVSGEVVHRCRKAVYES